MRETYDDLEWEIDETPIGSSTPDELFELSYRATTKCPTCGDEIRGTANYWSREEDMSNTWLNNIEYKECECDEVNNLDDIDDDL